MPLNPVSVGGVPLVVNNTSSVASPDIVQQSPLRVVSQDHQHLHSQDPPEIARVQSLCGGEQNFMPTSPPGTSHSLPIPPLASTEANALPTAQAQAAQALMSMRNSPGPSTPVRRASSDTIGLGM